MDNKRKRYQKQNNYEAEFLIKNPEYHLIYLELLKEARTWNGSGQYLLAKECEILATKLLNGSTEHVNVIVKTENNFYKTKKFI